MRARARSAAISRYRAAKSGSSFEAKRSSPPRAARSASRSKASHRSRFCAAKRVPGPAAPRRRGCPRGGPARGRAGREGGEVGGSGWSGRSERRLARGCRRVGPAAPAKGYAWRSANCARRAELGVGELRRRSVATDAAGRRAGLTSCGRSRTTTVPATMSPRRLPSGMKCHQEGAKQVGRGKKIGRAEQLRTEPWSPATGHTRSEQSDRDPRSRLRRRCPSWATPNFRVFVAVRRTTRRALARARAARGDLAAPREHSSSPAPGVTELLEPARQRAARREGSLAQDGGAAGYPERGLSHREGAMGRV